MPGALPPDLGAEAALFLEPKPPVEPDRGLVIGKYPEIDAMEPELPKGIVEERGKGLPAQPLAPVLGLADQDGELGVLVLQVEVAKRNRADEITAFFELEREEDRLLVREDSLQSGLGIREPLGTHGARLVEPHQGKIVPPAMEALEVLLAEGPKPKALGFKHGNSLPNLRPAAGRRHGSRYLRRYPCATRAPSTHACNDKRVKYLSESERQNHLSESLPKASFGASKATRYRQI